MSEPASEPPAAPTPTGGPERQSKIGLTPVSLFLVLLVAYVLIKIKLVLILTLLSLLFATVIERPIQLLERRRVPRALAILLVYIVLLGALALFGFIFVPVVSREATAFRHDAPAQLEALRASWQHSSNSLLSGVGQQLLGRAVDAMEHPPIPQETAMSLVTGVGGGIVSALAVLVITFYYLMEKRFLRRMVLLEVPPGSRARVARVWDDVEAKVGGWMRGQLLLCLTVGVSATVGYGILGLRFWPLLGLLAGVTELLPIVGPWLGGIPAVIIALTQSWEKAAIVTGFLVILQATENTILVPRIMRGAVGLTPLTVFVAITAGAEFMGVVGALLAIPIAAAAQVIVSDFLAARRQRSRAEAALPSWRWMRSHLLPVPPPEPPPEEPPAADREHNRAEERPPRIRPDEVLRDVPPPEPARRGWTGDRLAHARSEAGQPEMPEQSEAGDPSVPARRSEA